MEFASRLIQKLFGSSVPVDIDDLLLRQGDFVGTYARSPSGQWVVAWMDSEPGSQRGGARDAGEGAYLLYNTLTEQVVVRGRMPRPAHGHVANNGTFALVDVHFGQCLSGSFFVFNSAGKPLLKHDVSANIVLSALSSEGQYALFQTAFADTGDGSKLFLVDVPGGKQRFSVEPVAGWPERYEIDVSSGEVIAHFPNLGAFRYSSEGVFLEADRMCKSQADSPRYEHAIPRAREILGVDDLDASQAEEALLILERALDHGSDWIEPWKAQCLKLIGQAHEALGDYRAAVLAYDDALSFDAKIGVKRKRDALLKKL